MNKKHITIIIIVAIIALAALAAAVAFFIKNKQTEKEMTEMVEQLTFEKEQLESEYEDWALQIEGYGRNLQNDSLAEKLQIEQQRVQDLLEELRITKATSAKRIAELKKELATVRAVMIQYVQQIDSLSATNQRLTQENIIVRQQYEEVHQRATELEEQTAQLTEVVERAAMMEVSDFKLTQLNERDRKTSSLNKTSKLQFNFTIQKNITTAVGNKTVYLRLVRPDGELLQKSGNHLFQYENQQIGYSLKEQFEYGGESVDMVLYWNVEEVLPTGVYNADFFIDGSLVGSFPFTLK